jgi:transposase
MAKKRKSRCAWRLPDELWQRMQPLLPRYHSNGKGGRPRVDLKTVAQGTFYRALCPRDLPHGRNYCLI